MKKFYFFILAFTLPAMLWAQTATTETFEDETVGATSFTDNGQVFNITSQVGSFDIYSSTDGYGWNGTAADNTFIDNSSAVGAKGNNPVIQFTISSSGAVPFTLKSMWLYLSTQNTNDFGTGTLTITGKRTGTSVFTATVNTGFNTNTGVNNGYSFIDLTNFGAEDNSNVPIDEFVISTTGDFQYTALDALNWAKADIATPVQLSQFSGYLQKNMAHLSWQTGLESNFDHFELEKSVGDNSYSLVRSIAAKGNNSPYLVEVPQMEASATYRLKMIDLQDKISYSKQITLTGADIGMSAVFPNPAHDYINVSMVKDGQVTIYDVTGRSVKTVILSKGTNAVNISTLSTGMYYVKKGKEKISFVKN